MTTAEKTLTDHGISLVTRKDCALWRTVEGNDICHEVEDSITTLADASSMPATINTDVKFPKPTLGATVIVQTNNNNIVWRETPEFPMEEPIKAVAAPPSLAASAPEVMRAKTELKASPDMFHYRELLSQGRGLEVFTQA